jgi:hypothetical protein
MDSRQGGRLGDVDLLDAGVGMSAAHEHAVQHVR